MKNRQNILKATKLKEVNLTSEDISRNSTMPLTKMPMAKQRLGSAAEKRVQPKTREMSDVDEVSPQLYKAVHNIGRRKTAERFVSYKETEIAVCFKDSYWPNATLDLSNATRSEPAKGRSLTEKTNPLTFDSKTENPHEEKAKHEKSSGVETEMRLDLSREASTQLPSNTKVSKRKSSRLSDESVKRSGDEKLGVLLTSGIKDYEDVNVSTKNQIRLSSKKRSELSFLALGLSNSVGSDVFSQKPKAGDQQQEEGEGVRVRRTASLNAGAIVSLMLQKEGSAAKKKKLSCDDDDEDDDDSTSSSSESGESAYSEYSAPSGCKKKKTNSNVNKTSIASNAEKAISPNESSKEKPCILGISSLASESAAVQRKRSVPKEGGSKPLEDSSSVASENSVSPSRCTGSQSDAAKDSSAFGVGQESAKGMTKPALALASLKSPLPNFQTAENEAVEAKGKRKRREFQDTVMPAVIPGKRMASLNAQAILAASRDDRAKCHRGPRNKLSELATKSRSSSTEGKQLASDVQSKASKNSVSGGKPFSSSAKLHSSIDSHRAQKSSVALCEGDSRADDLGSLSMSKARCGPLDRAPFPGTYVELVSPPSSIQLVEMTSAPDLTPNKTYQQLGRPQNCQPYSADRQLASVWSGNRYNSTNGHVVEFPKNSSDRLTEKPSPNVVTALIPRATSLSPAIPIRFTAHIVPQNPLPQHGFYGRLQPCPPYYSERFPYGRPNLFSYPTNKAFNTSGCFTSPRIPTDLYNASRQLQVYEVQTARPVYGRQSDFNLQLCQPQFIGQLTSHTESHDHLQQLYRPYLSPPANQSFQRSHRQTMCAPPYGPSQVQVALSVVTPLAPEKPPSAINGSCQDVLPDGKLLKTSPSDGQPRFTDISYSVVKRSNLSSRRKQVETKHSSTQVKNHGVISSASGARGMDCGLLPQEKPLPENIKPMGGGRLPDDDRMTEKAEESIVCELNKTDFSACQIKLPPPLLPLLPPPPPSPPPAHCQSYASGNKPVGPVEELSRSDLQSSSGMCVASHLPERESLAKQEDFKLNVSDRASVTEIKPVSDAGEPVTDAKPVNYTEEPVIPYSKTEFGCQGLHYDALPLQNLPPEKLEHPRPWSREVSRVSHHQNTPEKQSSIIDLSLDKRLDHSRRKTEAVELSEDLLETFPLEKKKPTPGLSSRTSESGRNKNTPLCHDVVDLIPSSCVSGNPCVVSSTEVVPTGGAPESSLSQLQSFIPTHSTEMPNAVLSDTVTEQANKSDAKVTEVKVPHIGSDTDAKVTEVGVSHIESDTDAKVTEVRVPHIGSATDAKVTEIRVPHIESDTDACISKNKDPDYASVVRCKESKGETATDDDDDDVASSVATDPGPSDANSICLKDSNVELMTDCIVIDVHIWNVSTNKSNEGITSPNSKTALQEFATSVESELSQMEAEPMSAAAVMDLTESPRPLEVTADERGIVTERADLSDGTQPRIKKTESENGENSRKVTEAFFGSSNRNSHKKCRQSFRGSVALGLIEGSAKLAKRINLLGFANRSLSEKRRHKIMDVVRRSRSNCLSGAALSRRKSTKTSKHDGFKVEKEMALSFEGKAKGQMHFESPSQQRSGSEMDGTRGGVSEDEGVKCWKWKEPGMTKRICTEVDGQMVTQVCYPAIEHANGDVIRVRDCVFVRSGMRRKDVPYIAKIFAFWPFQETGEMMMGVFWYYRHHQSDGEHVMSKYLSNEVFASRHRDVIPVTCIEDRCYVLTLNEFCRFKADQKRTEFHLPERRSLVPETSDEPYGRLPFQPPPDADPDTVFLCRNIYDVKLRRISKHPRRLRP